MRANDLLIAPVLAFGQICFAADCGVEASYIHGSAVTIEFERSFDLDKGMVLRAAEENPVFLSVEKGRVTIAGKPVPVLALSRGDRFFFGGDHYGCWVTHIVRDGVAGLWVSDGAEMPLTKSQYESENFIPATVRLRKKPMANQSLEPTRVGKPPLAAQLLQGLPQESSK